MVEELPFLEADETDDEATAEISPEVDNRRLDKKNTSNRNYISKPLEEFTAVDTSVGPQPAPEIQFLHARTGRYSIKQFERSLPHEILEYLLRRS